MKEYTAKQIKQLEKNPYVFWSYVVVDSLN